MAKKLTIPAIKLKQPAKKGQNIYLCTIKVKDLLDETNFKINWWEKEKMGSSKQGYQRKPTQSRLAKIARYIEKCENPIFPTGLLISTDKNLEFNGSSGVGKLTLPGHSLWIVDGQTRTEGFRYAVEKLNLTYVLDDEIPMTILTGFKLIEELEQFFLLNSTQKRVATDLAQRLKLQLALENPDEYKALDVGEDWELKALKIVDPLNDHGVQPWNSRIRLPNTVKVSSNIISQNSFVRSLKPLYKGGELENVNVDDAVESIKNYWLALEEIFPDAFRRAQDYVIQKTPGVFSLHKLANSVFKYLFSQNKSYSVKNIKGVLEIVFADRIYDADSFYWQKDNRDGASRHGSMKGFGILASEFLDNMPSIDIKTS